MSNIMTMATKPAKGARLTGPERDKLNKAIISDYVDKNLSIRAISEKRGRSYGAVHRILAESDNVTIRGRGGSHLTRTTTKK